MELSQILGSHPKSAGLPSSSDGMLLSRDSDRKSICFVIGDEEIFFGRDILVGQSPYIAHLVRDLDPSKVRLFDDNL